MPEIQKVIDPNKVVTDKLLLKRLAEQGIDKDYVEFYQDYASRRVNGKVVKGRSPYAKFYRDLKSKKRFMVVSILPKVDANGDKIEVGWQKQGSKFVARRNLFACEAMGVSVSLVCLSDQPDGRKAGESLNYESQIFLNGIEVKPQKVKLLAIDPINENYTENTLEWDYGICKRWLRIIEGRLHGYWAFNTDPNGEVHIEYNQSGDFKLRLSEFAVDDDTEVIPVQAFITEDPEPDSPPREYPFIVRDSTTFYPDAHEETSSVDGDVTHYDSGGLDWAVIRGGAGTEAYDEGTTLRCTVEGDSITDKYDRFRKPIFLFDTSALGAGAEISAATLSLYGGTKDDTLYTPSINIVASAPASNTVLAAGDFNSLGSVKFCDTDIAYADWANDYNDFILNASGLAAIDKEGVSKFGGRETAKELPDIEPTWANDDAELHMYAADQGTGYKPKLVVTYTGILDYPISTSCGLTVSANVDRDVTWDRTVDSALTLAASLVAVFGRTIVTSTGLTLTTSLARAMTYTRATSSGLTLLANVVRTFPRAIATSCGLTLATSISIAKGFKRAVSSTLSLTTSVARVLTFDRATSTALSLTTNIARKLDTTRASSSGLTLATSVSRVVAYIRATSTAVSLAVSIIRVLARTIITSAALSLTTSVNRTMTYTRETTTNLSLTVNLVRTWAITRVTSMGITLSTSISRVVAYTRTMSSNLSLLTNIVKSWGRKITISVALSVSVTIRYCVVLRELARLAIGRMSVSRMLLGRISHWRRRRTCT